LPEQIRVVPTDAALRLSVDALRQAVDEDVRLGRIPSMVIAAAGTTNTGAIDPLDALADFCEERHLWLHADAAYGWVAALTAATRPLLQGIDRADSISFDPHKWFGQPYEAGCLLVRHGEFLTDAFAVRPEYMQDVHPDEGEVNFCDHGIALTRRFRALKIWLSVKVLGLHWFRRLVEHGCNLADLTAALLEQSGEFEVFAPRQLSVVCLRYVPHGWTDGERLNALNRAVCAEAVRTRRVFIATTRLGDTDWIRVCFVNWRTMTADVEEVVQLLTNIGRRTAAEQGNAT
jgi:glutamate/tyrosine decarboxylase-like PLP-dependent enzyme